MDLLKKIESLGIVPVIKLNNARHALPLGRALLNGGLPIAEVTFRTDAAEESINTLSKELPEILVGAGTVLTIGQVDRAINAGAKFIVAPGFNPEIVDYCLSKDIPVFPGVNSPTQVEMGISRGLSVLKFFPAEASGGLKALKAISAAYGSIRFMPTGGVNPGNIGEYLRFDKIVACGGSWMVKPELIEEERFDKISSLASEAIRNAIDFRFAHVGINTGDAGKAGEFVDTIQTLFGLKSTEGNSSHFISSEMEVVKGTAPGEKGHIAIGVNSLPMAIASLERSGIQFDRTTEKYKGKRLVAIYLKNEIGGFAFHLVQRS